MIFWIELSLLTISLFSNIDIENNYNKFESKWSVRYYGGYSTHRPLIAIVTLGDIRPEYHGTGIRGIDISRNLYTNWRKYPIDWSFRVGYIRHNENGFQPNHNQYNFFLLAHNRTKYKGFPIRWFIGNGLSWSQNIPFVEGRETRRLSNERDSKLMNYINIGFDFRVGDIIGNDFYNNIKIGFADSHRSGVFKKIKWFNHTQGGSNYVTLFIEYDF
tara:strand:- start:110 stop:757 length:648 start_codon:yes stop_codon:yes gene_type:complete